MKLKTGCRKFVILLVVLSVVIFLLCYIAGSRLDALQKSANLRYQRNYSKCDIIHIGIVWIGYQSNFYIYTMLKSLYFYRNNPLHFHIIVDDISEKNLENMFNRWAVPQVTITYYNVNTFPLYSTLTLDNVKLMFPEIIPTKTTSKLIIINTYVTFVQDVYQLWNIFDYFETNQALGLVENQNDTCSEKTNSDLETAIIGERFNTDIVLVNLEVLKTAGWEELLIRAVSEIMPLPEHGTPSDQIIINAIAVQNNELLYTLPCHENPQISDRSYNYHSQNRATVVNWNNPSNLMSTDNKDDYFRNLQGIFHEHNGTYHRTPLHECAGFHENVQVHIVKETSKDTCEDFHKAYAYKWRTLLFFREFKHNSSEDDVTLVSHFSYDRLPAFEKLVERWEGPISLTLYATDSELYRFMNFIEKSKLLQNRFNIGYHAIFREHYHHPINLCRNVALRNVVTPYVFLNDIDFIPMQGLYDSLKDSVSSMQGMEKKILVVPAFNVSFMTKQIPKTKADVLKIMRKMQKLHVRKPPTAVGQFASNLQKWKTAKMPYKIVWKEWYEPYIVAQSNITEFDERFVGYGYDKLSFISKLQAQGYEFIVLPNAFIVHKKHNAASSKFQWLNSKRYSNCLDELFSAFNKELKETYRLETSDLISVIT